jgi:hypothetical protein
MRLPSLRPVRPGASNDRYGRWSQNGHSSQIQTRLSDVAAMSPGRPAKFSDLRTVYQFPWRPRHSAVCLCGRPPFYPQGSAITSGMAGGPARQCRHTAQPLQMALALAVPPPRHQRQRRLGLEGGMVDVWTVCRGYAAVKPVSSGCRRKETVRGVPVMDRSWTNGVQIEITVKNIDTCVDRRKVISHTTKPC